MMALQKSVELGLDNEGRFAVLMHDLGKATTPANILPAHHGHEQRGVKLVKNFCKKWRAPKSYTELALITTEYHTHVHRAFELKSTTLLKFLKQTDCFRKPERFQKFLDACLSDARGRTNFEECEYPQADFLAKLAQTLRQAELGDVKKKGLEGKALGDEIDRLYVVMIDQQVRQAGDHSA